MSIDPLEKFKKIYIENPEIAKTRGRVTESDTRSNILDRIIHEVLEWPRNNVEREPHVDSGYIDYLFTHGRPIIIWEAKAEGETFVLPYRKKSRRKMSLHGSLTTDKNIKNVISQVQRYCIDEGATFAVATNGYSFIVFRAINEGSPWGKGVASVFCDYNDVVSNFTEFWNLLSYEAIVNGSLNKEFKYSIKPTRGYYRPISQRTDANSFYSRNSLSNVLRPFAEKFFGDIATQDTVDLLEHCYVYEKPIQNIDENLNLIIKDQSPMFSPGIKQLYSNEENKGGELGSHIETTIGNGKARGTVVMLMGGIGAGKSTYCQRFFRVVSPDLVSDEGPSVLYYLNFLGSPDDETHINDYLWKIIAEQIKNVDKSGLELQALKEIFEEDIKIIENIFGKSEQTDARISEKIYELTNNDEVFAENYLSYKSKKGKVPFLVFDNVDQLKSEVQAQVFTTCHRIAIKCNSVSLLVLREESFSSALMKKHLTAYNVTPFHLSSPSFRKLLKIRVEYAVNSAVNAGQSDTAPDEVKKYGQVVQLFSLLRESILGYNKNIIRLIESVAYGNMRLALKMFNSFIVSGATDMEKIVNAYTTYDKYIVPFHEFVKSVMLNDYRYYKESRSDIVNVFSVNGCHNSSHFTILRILNYLSMSGQKEKSADGFAPLDELISEIADNFNNEEDCKLSLLKLISVDKQLVELDSRRSDVLDGASGARITTSGQYYLQSLSKTFSYLDLVWHDTPLDSLSLAADLSKRIYLTDMEERFERIKLFLDYLMQQEKEEFSEYNMNYTEESHLGPFMPKIFAQVTKARYQIRKKMEA